jgi:hypothetical protein
MSGSFLSFLSSCDIAGHRLIAQSPDLVVALASEHNEVEVDVAPRAINVFLLHDLCGVLRA